MGKVRIGSDGVRAEILYNGVWGTICDDGFENEDAIAFCSTLNGHPMPLSTVVQLITQRMVVVLLMPMTSRATENPIYLTVVVHGARIIVVIMRMLEFIVPLDLGYVIVSQLKFEVIQT